MSHIYSAAACRVKEKEYQIHVGTCPGMSPRAIMQVNLGESAIMRHAMACPYINGGISIRSVNVGEAELETTRDSGTSCAESRVVHKLSVTPDYLRIPSSLRAMMAR